MSVTAANKEWKAMQEQKQIEAQHTKIAAYINSCQSGGCAIYGEKQLKYRCVCACIWNDISKSVSYILEIIMKWL